MERLNLRLGCDLVFMLRLEKHLDHETFLNRILTPKEKALYHELKTSRRKLEFLSGRYAAKEAYAKAKGAGIGVVDFLDFEVLKDDLGKPISNLADVSISHDEDYAMAVVMLYG